MLVQNLSKATSPLFFVLEIFMKLLPVLLLLTASIGAAALSASLAAQAPAQVTWTFDNLERIGGLPVRVEGNPKVIDNPVWQGHRVRRRRRMSSSSTSIRWPGAGTYTFEAIILPEQTLLRNPRIGQGGSFNRFDGG
jgi:hypothetical protein